MSHLREINFRDIKRRFYDQTSAPMAVDWYITSYSNVELINRMLRDHNEAGIYDSEELKIRDAFDALLAFYSQLEIASIADFISEQLPNEVIDQAKKILGNPSLVTFYREHYPLLLPQLFLERINGNFNLRYGADQRGQRTTSYYLAMLEVCRPMNEDTEVQAFLRCLDDFMEIQGNKVILSLDLIINAIQDPAVYSERLGRPTGERESLDIALQGYVKFLSFCLNFDQLLQSSLEYPLLASAFWHDQSYWFRMVRDRAKPAIAKSLEQFYQWETYLIPEEKQSFEETARSIRKLEDIISKLFGDAYAVPLIQEASQWRLEISGF